jgi:hypothetical protein
MAIEPTKNLPLLLVLVTALCLHLVSAIPPLKPELQGLGFDVPLERLGGDGKGSRLPAARYRLPENVFPTNYKLEIQPILDEDGEIGTRFTALGRIWITVNCTADTMRVPLHSNTLDIHFDSITV